MALEKKTETMADAIHDFKQSQNRSKFVGSSIKLETKAAIAHADTHGVRKERCENQIDT